MEIHPFLAKIQIEKKENNKIKSLKEQINLTNSGTFVTNVNYFL